MDAPAPTKRCARCGETKQLDAFNRRAADRDGCQPYCRDCERAAKRERVAARVAEGRCRQVGCPNDAAPGRTRCGEHLAANRARHRARIADGRNAAAKRAWRERNIAQGYCANGPGHGPPVAGSTKCARCRARANARYRKTMIEFTAILSDQGVDHDGRCELCGLAEATQVDHVRPRSRGGLDEDPLLLRWVCDLQRQQREQPRLETRAHRLGHRRRAIQSGRHRLPLTHAQRWA